MTGAVVGKDETLIGPVVGSRDGLIGALDGDSDGDADGDADSFTGAEDGGAMLSNAVHTPSGGFPSSVCSQGRLGEIQKVELMNKSGIWHLL